MTEQDWNEATDPGPMLEFLEGRASERKLLIFAAACCRRAWNLMTNPGLRNAVEAAERLADGLLTRAEFEDALQPTVAAWGELSRTTATPWQPSRYMISAARHLGSGGAAPYAADFAARGLACRAGEEDGSEWLAARQVESRAQCDLLRDLFGNPLRPFRFNAAWLAGEGRLAAERAQSIYNEERFESLRSLSDVLEAAGCRDVSVLEHCRQQGRHIRGCWVVDALLGRETAVRTGLLTEADWQNCVDPEPLLHILRDRGRVRKWRLFAVACCRRIRRLITDERSRRAVEVAGRSADDAATEEEMESARVAAQAARDEAKDAEYTAEAEANFCITPRYAAVCCRLYAASAARSAVCRDPRKTDAEAGTFEADYWSASHAMTVAAVADEVYAGFGSNQSDSRWAEARCAAESARAAELRAQCDLLRDLFGDYLGPPGEEGSWLPVGLEMGAHPMSQTVQWCQLPTARRPSLPQGWQSWNDGTLPQLARAIYAEEAFDRLPILADALEDAGCGDADLLQHLRGPDPHVRGCWVLDLVLGRE